ncbi:MAG: phosphodiester glycosidase family protein [Candidatus Roizmanbacteria bacterium]|nr:phosphodiester glycosidase family protein [Candidatus Roizmanbacteria bacterium]
MKKKFKNLLVIFKIGVLAIFLGVIAIGAFYYYKKTTSQILLMESNKIKLDKALKNAEINLKNLRSQDQYLINKDLESTVKSIETTYSKAVAAYEKLLDLKSITKKTEKFDSSFSDILTLLSKRNYALAKADLLSLEKEIDTEKQKVLASFQIPANVPENNSPPGSGYSSQVVKSDVGDFLVGIISADLNSTRVIVDTASNSDCKNDCPVMSLGDYVSRSGAFAGINGSYFCPADYPSCSDKKNSFDTLAMNKNKKYLNSDNNVYSTVPAVIFTGNSARFVGQSSQWGRDTGVDAVLAMQPLLVSGGNIAFNGDGEPKRGSKGNRSFVGASGSTAYIGIVFNATVAEAAHVIHALGIQNALNLDSGGSTALWSGGYKAGPGRNLPNVLLFVKK